MIDVPALLSYQPGCFLGSQIGRSHKQNVAQHFGHRFASLSRQVSRFCRVLERTCVNLLDVVSVI
jgi:hypothetical protein